jgi:uncharacterized protein with ParB-like and HNH nuclease domain
MNNQRLLKNEDFEKIFKSHLKIETYSKSIDSLFSERMLRKIDYKPYYQRNYVWDEHKATYFLESILLGTEIPPLIFFNDGEKIEVIDGRQRFETIKRFMQDGFKLTKKGLLALKQLGKKSYLDLAKDDLKIRNLFDDAKIRIFEFKIVNEQRLDLHLEDKIKKEIFGRYNSGITPLKRSEIDNAKFDEDIISKYFKKQFEKPEIKEDFKIFFHTKKVNKGSIPIETLMNFTRKSISLTICPIKYYARGTGRTELIQKAYEYYSNTILDKELFFKNFMSKVAIVNLIYQEFEEEGLNCNWLVLECLLWTLLILEENNFDLNVFNIKSNQKKIAKYLSLHIKDFDDRNYHYYKTTVDRYNRTSKCIDDLFDEDLAIYVHGSSDSKKKIKNLKKDEDTQTKLNELESLRITKPDPSRNSIDDLIRLMGKSRFLVRPSYQRSEVINLTKASAIIESMLLGIPLPAIFIYKRDNGVSEVIDGQQRLLTILGFIGAYYKDEKGNDVITNNNQFPLRKLSILDNLNKRKFDELPDKLQDKILDFEIYIVEIEEKLNSEFNPIDLFIRLNDKPYPIRQNSFEMWNSWADRDITESIKTMISDVKFWFYLRRIKDENDRDRMENEDLFMSLVFLDYENRLGTSNRKYLAIYQKGNRINARIDGKQAITNLLESTYEKTIVKEQIIVSIENISFFVEKVKALIFSDQYENIDLDYLMNPNSSKYFRRTLQDFYILWNILDKIPLMKINENIQSLRNEIRSVFSFMKKVPIESLDSGNSVQDFNLKIDTIIEKHK